MAMIDSPSFPDPNQVSYRQTALRYGAIWGGFSVFTILLGYLTDTDPSMPSTGTGIKVAYGLLGFGVAIWAVSAAIKQHRDRELGGFISMGRAVMVALTVGLVAGVIGAVFMLLYSTVINPAYSETMQAAIQAQWEAQGMTEEQIEQMSGMSGFMGHPVFIFLSQVIGGAIFGLIIGLIAGAVMKKDRPFA